MGHSAKGLTAQFLSLMTLNFPRRRMRQGVNALRVSVTVALLLSCSTPLTASEGDESKAIPNEVAKKSKNDSDSEVGNRKGVRETESEPVFLVAAGDRLEKLLSRYPAHRQISSFRETYGFDSS